MIRPSFYVAVRLLAVLLTVLVIVAHQYLPPKILPLYPSPDRLSWVFGPEHEGTPSIDWIDRENGHFWCNYAVGDIYSCGWSLNLGPDRTSGIDLSEYDGLNILVHHKGNSPRIRAYLRDFNPAYSDVDNFEVSSKVMYTSIRTSDLGEPAYVRLSEFSVAEWWVTQFDIAREHSAPSLNNVIVFGLDFNVHGNNEVRVERIDAVGAWIKKETLYFGIIATWMTLIILEVLSRYHLIHRKSQADAARISRLAKEYKKLEIEKRGFEELSTTDVLTGVMNRAGIHQFLQRLFSSDIGGSEAGLLLIDIDHFKKINDQFGHDVGDIVLSKLARIISQNIRQTDVVGRWGGEEFILLCPKISEEYLPVFAEKLREIIEQHAFETPAQSLKVTVSIGATSLNAREAFDIAFKRADIALYQAKNHGRNRVQIERP
jgi:diguanylate cyclase (GGDEF)-like protein